MDPRFRRSRDQLREAVYRLAAETPITEVTVAELCRAAGVTRDTFYRHAPSPVALLAEVLSDDLSTEAIAPSAETQDAPGMASRGLRVLLQHVAAHADVYRNAMQPNLIAPLRSGLQQMFREGLLMRARSAPEVLPAALAGDPLGLDVAAEYAAAGGVGALEVWLATPDLDVDRGVRVILGSAPSFWLDDEDRALLGL